MSLIISTLKNKPETKKTEEEREKRGKCYQRIIYLVYITIYEVEIINYL